MRCLGSVWRKVPVLIIKRSGVKSDRQAKPGGVSAWGSSWIKSRAREDEARKGVGGLKRKEDGQWEAWQTEEKLDRLVRR